MAKTAAKTRVVTNVICPVCLSDNLDPISPRMNKCLSCGFIWNHEVSNRDNLMLIVEHQTKLEKATQQAPAPTLRIVRQKARGRKKIAR